MSGVTLPKSLHLYVFPPKPVSSVVRGGTAALLSATRSWACLGLWHHGGLASGAIAAVHRYNQWIQGKSRVLLELLLPYSPSLHTGRTVQDTCRRLCREESPALQANHGGVQPCRGEEREAQMAADALISGND